MEAIENIANFLNKEILLKDNRPAKLELDLKMLLSKEHFNEVVKLSVTKSNVKTCDQCESVENVSEIINPYTGKVDSFVCDNCNEENYERLISEV